MKGSGGVVTVKRVSGIVMEVTVMLRVVGLVSATFSISNESTSEEKVFPCMVITGEMMEADTEICCSSLHSFVMMTLEVTNPSVETPLKLTETESLRPGSRSMNAGEVMNGANDEMEILWRTVPKFVTAIFLLADSIGQKTPNGRSVVDTAIRKSSFRPWSGMEMKGAFTASLVISMTAFRSPAANGEKRMVSASRALLGSTMTCGRFGGSTMEKSLACVPRISIR